MMPDFEVSPFHQLIIDYLEFLLNRHIRELAIITPPAYALGRNPTETIIRVSCGSELSETWGRRVRNILSDPAFSEVFPTASFLPIRPLPIDSQQPWAVNIARLAWASLARPDEQKANMPPWRGYGAAA